MHICASSASSCMAGYGCSSNPSLQGHQTPGPGSRPSLSPLLTRHIAFNSGVGRSERRPSLLGAQPAGQREGGQQQMLASPGSSQGFRKRERFLTRTGSQPVSDTPVLQSPARPVSAPATGQPSVGGPHAERAATSHGGTAMKNPISAATCRNHLLRGTADAAAAAPQHALCQARQQQAPPGSSTPVQALCRPEFFATSHTQQAQGTEPMPAIVGSMPQQPQQQPLPPDYSLPSPATGKAAQSAKPDAHHDSIALKQAKQTGPASAQGGVAAQRTHHHHISLEETYRESKQAAPPQPAVPGHAAMSGE